MFWHIVLLISCVKLLFIHCYRSTDFEVHRNWLAITYSLPVSKWYVESTSEWTLDYPPLFAWFEFILSQFAQFFDPQMLQVKNLNYASAETVLFQRLSVIIADLVFAYGTKECCQYLSTSGVKKSSKWAFRWSSPATILQLLLLGNCGLLIVDHIHFQYNGMLFGILLISVAHMLQGKFLQSAFWFAVLLNMKHTFMYIAPVYFVYLLRNYCFRSTQVPKLSVFSVKNFMKLVLILVIVFSISFGPFIFFGQIQQVAYRLFPFKRGLCHAYWAPNVWAIYNVIDKVMAVIGKQLGITVPHSEALMTGGLVKEFHHVVLPVIEPKTTFILTGISILPALLKLWFSPGNPFHFVRCIIICAATAFMFGWHVHEKAILMVIIPLSLMAVLWKKEAQFYLLFAITGHYSLFPLIFTPFEIPLKVILLLIHSLYAFLNLSSLFDTQKSKLSLPLLSCYQSIYILGLILLFLFETVIHPWSRLYDKFPFLPLLFTSVYCSMGILYSWFKYYWNFLTINEVNHKRKAH